MTKNLLIDFPNEWLRLQRHAERLARETGLELELDGVYVKGDHLVAGYNVPREQGRAVIYASTPIGNRQQSPKWWRKWRA